MIEYNFDIPFIADLALREKQIQQNYRPIIAVHKWFARRPGTLFRGLLLSEFADRPLRECFYSSNNLQGLSIADPFMGGGTPLLEANRMGADVVGLDINPMAYWIVKEEIEHFDLDKYRNSAAKLGKLLESEIGDLYRTQCLKCGDPAWVKYFLWVKTKDCSHCGRNVDLFPGYLIAKNRRHPKYVLVCSGCGELNEVANLRDRHSCRNCQASLVELGPAKKSQCACPHCGRNFSFGKGEPQPLDHKMIAVEYHCFRCRSSHSGRFFKKPDQGDLNRFQTARNNWRKTQPEFVPDEEIPGGDETDRLHRWGFRKYRQMFNERQLYSLELACRLIRSEQDERIRNALATNLSDLLRYQNMLCRYDTMALKSLDIFSVHGFPVGLVQCESNFMGLTGEKGNIGSGGWLNIVNKFAKAKAFCTEPFEVLHDPRGKRRVAIKGEWIGDLKNGSGPPAQRIVRLFCADAASAALAPDSLDGVFTDPPYFGNVQYAELMDFCYVWLRRLIPDLKEFSKNSTRSANELTVNANMGRGLERFAEGLSAGFGRFARALKDGAPFAFTYHHNRLEAYFPVAVAVLDAGLTCSASLPSPAEMGASIHINGTGSSIIDTVFVCRRTGKLPARWIADTPSEVADLVLEDLRQLKAGRVKTTTGDIRCIIFGHLVRLAIWSLRKDWDSELPISRRIVRVADWISSFGGPPAVERELSDILSTTPKTRRSLIRDPIAAYDAEISF